MKKRALVIMLVLSLLVSGSGIIAMAEGNYVAIIDDIGYSTLEAVQQEIDNGNQGTIELQQDIGELMVNGREVYVDLNGHNIGNVTVTNDGTFYGSDSQSNDFESQSEADYGIIGTFTGNVQAAFSPEVDGCGYLMFSDNGTNASFHYVRLEITDMVLRPQKEGEDTCNPSLYYQCDFKGDKVVADNVETFGVALSLVDEPAKIGLAQCGYSYFTDFEAGPDGNPDQNTGTLLYGIMKPTNATSINKRNADLMVYGQAYLKIKNGGYVFGNARNRSFKKQLEKANELWTVLDNEQKAGIRTMYQEYENIMQPWNLTGVTTQYADVVEDAVTWYKEFQNLPVANADMSVNQLRQLTVDFFRLQQSFKWTPNTTFIYHDTEKQNEEFCDYTTLEPNVVYKGVPYCMTGAYELIDGVEQPINTSIGKSGSIYKAMNFYDPATGVLDLATIYARNGAQAVYDVLTSNCGNGLSWGWNRVSNSVKTHSGAHYTPANGALPVGYYLWNEAEMSYVDDDGEIKTVENVVSKIFAAQGTAYKGRFYKAYAQLQPGDGLFTDGHLRMCSGVRVVRDENDAILPGQSYVWYIDMNSNGSTDRYIVMENFKDYTYTQDNGYLVRDLGGIREHIVREGLDDYPGTPISFADLVKEDQQYIPITIPEFSTKERIEEIRDQSQQDFIAAGKEEIWNEHYAPKYQALIDNMAIEEPNVSFNKVSYYTTPVTPTKLTTGFGGSIEANYVISNVRITLQDSNGKVLLEEDPIIHTTDRTTAVKIPTKLLPASDVLTQETLTQYAGKGNKVIISVQLSTGEWVEALNAELIAG